MLKERPILFNADMVRALLDGRKTQTRRIVPKWQMPQETEGPHDSFPDSRWMSVAQRDRRWGFGVFGATENECMDNYNIEYGSLCPYGRPSDHLYVKETFYAWGRWVTEFNEKKGRDSWRFIDMTLECGKKHQFSQPIPMGNRVGVTPAWHKRPSLFMPRIASRITLEIVSVRVERLHDISEADAHTEGCQPMEGCKWHTFEEAAAGIPMHDHTAKDAFSALWERINGAESWDANPWVWVVEFKRVEACQ